MLIQLLQGALSGFAATAPMTGVMKWGHRELPIYERYPLPPRLITMRLAERAGIRHQLSDSEKQSLTLISHFGYGSAMGSLYALVFSKRYTGSTSGAIFGLGVWAGSYLGLLPAMGILSPATKHPARRNLLMIVAHLVWGSVAGAVLKELQSNEITGPEKS